VVGRVRPQRCRADRDELVLQHRWIAEYGARRFGGRGEPFDDLFQVAQLGVVKAAERFDPDRGQSFPAYAIPTVLGELRRYFRDAAWTIHVGRRSKELSVAIRHTAELLTQELGRTPTVDDLADRLGVAAEEVLLGMDALEANRTHPLPERPTEDGMSALYGGASDDDVAVRAVIREAIHELPSEDRIVVHLRFYEGRTQKEIAACLGTNQVQVCRQLRRICRRLAPFLVDLR
jgi:RNA polymerase sigma-B factor